MRGRRVALRDGVPLRRGIQTKKRVAFGHPFSLRPPKQAVDSPYLADDEEVVVDGAVAYGAAYG